MKLPSETLEPAFWQEVCFFFLIIFLLVLEPADFASMPEIFLALGIHNEHISTKRKLSFHILKMKISNT